MKKILISAALICSFLSFAQQKPAKEDILKMLDKMGSSTQMKIASKQILNMIPQPKQAAFLLEFEGIMAKIKDKSADVYMEYFTADDVKAILAFYETPAGKKITESVGPISEKVQEASMAMQSEIQAIVMKYAQ